MLNNPIKVAVCLAAFNGEQHIAEQIDSILNQVDVDVTVYVSVDLSSDNTLALVEAYGKKDARVVLLSYGERYGSAARNFFRLIEEVNFNAFDYVSLADQDDIWLSKKLSSAVSVMTTNKADAYSSNVQAFWPDGREKVINKAQPQQQWDYVFESAGPGCTFVINKNLALALQAFLLKNKIQTYAVALHDWFIYAYARYNNYQWVISEQVHMRYRQHSHNVVGANVGVRAKLTRWKKLREGWLHTQALIIANIVGYTQLLPIQKMLNMSLVNTLWLVFNVRKLRRRFRDCMAIAIYFLVAFK